jgi:hypothetical protein
MFSLAATLQFQISSLVSASVLFVANAALALLDSHEFIPATATDARSSCPGLNT